MGCPHACHGVRADREARGVAVGDYFENPLAYTWCGVIERSCMCIYLRRLGH